MRVTKSPCGELTIMICSEDRISGTPSDYMVALNAHSFDTPADHYKLTLSSITASFYNSGTYVFDTTSSGPVICSISFSAPYLIRSANPSGRSKVPNRGAIFVIGRIFTGDVDMPSTSMEPVVITGKSLPSTLNVKFFLDTGVEETGARAHVLTLTLTPMN